MATYYQNKVYEKQTISEKNTCRNLDEEPSNAPNKSKFASKAKKLKSTT